MDPDATPRVPLAPEPPPRRRPTAPRGVVLAVSVSAAFLIGLVLGNAVGDRPRDGRPVTLEGTVRVVTITESVAEVTTTVVTGGG